MAVRTEAQKRADAKYKASHMAQQNIAIKRETLDEFKRIAAERGDKVNTILRVSIEQYIASHTSSPAPLPLPTGWAEQKPSVLRTLRTPDGWQLDVDDDGRAYGAWLSHSSCSVKVFLAGADKSKHTIDEFTSIILADIDAYKADYRHDYM